MRSDIETVAQDGNSSNMGGSQTTLHAPNMAPDPNIVCWGPGDPEHPRNWPFRKRALHVVIISFMSFTV
jgi:hypothetical protein